MLDCWYIVIVDLIHDHDGSLLITVEITIIKFVSDTNIKLFKFVASILVCSGCAVSMKHEKYDLIPQAVVTL